MTEDDATADNESRPAVGAPVEPSVRPRAWLCTQCGNTSACEGALPGDNWCNSCGACETMQPLFDEAAREAARDEGYAIGRETEAEYWRSMVERLTAQADEWNRRYMALLQQVADGRAMQPAPALVVDLGPNAELT